MIPLLLKYFNRLIRNFCNNVFRFLAEFLYKSAITVSDKARL